MAVLDTRTYRAAARKFGLLKGNTLLLEAESELIILGDFCIYSLRGRGETTVARYLATLPTTNSEDDAAVRDAMERTRYSIYRLEEQGKRAVMRFQDMLRGDRLWVVDENLSRTLKRGALLAGRMIPVPTYWMSTGAAFPVSNGVLGVVKSALPVAPGGTEETLPQARAEMEEQLARMIIGAGLIEGTTGMISYA
ncbi:MAG TPA: hypothetical protein VM008_18545 [Phycisphaerae bacterium]|nr:hypothetical protein [Phycisphaerae bacterium]